jgi:hypothetical protein
MEGSIEMQFCQECGGFCEANFQKAAYICVKCGSVKNPDNYSASISYVKQVS